MRKRGERRGTGAWYDPVGTGNGKYRFLNWQEMIITV